MHPSSTMPQASTESGGQLPAIDVAQLPDQVVPRRATIPDVDGMSALINEFASARIMLARGPLYLYQSIQDYRVLTMPGKGAYSGREVVVGCGGLHVLWEDLAEVRSVAVHPSLQRKHFGRSIVEALIADATRLGVKHVFTFTLAEGFFSKLGFRAIPRETLPPVVWAECSKCPKFYKCDEIGMMLELP